MGEGRVTRGAGRPGRSRFPEMFQFSCESQRAGRRPAAEGDDQAGGRGRRRLHRDGVARGQRSLGRVQRDQGGRRARAARTRLPGRRTPSPGCVAHRPDRRHAAPGASRLLRARSCPAPPRHSTSTTCGPCSAPPGTPTSGRPRCSTGWPAARPTGRSSCSPRNPPANCERSREHGFPFVVVDPRTEVPDGIPVVCAAHSSGATQATRHLLELGHRRIGVIGGPESWVATQERLRGYHAALAGHGVLPDDPSSGTRTSASTAAAPRRRRCSTCRIRRPRSSRSTTAWRSGRCRRLPRAGCESRLTSVVGFDDTVEATVVVPALTTVRQPLAELGRTAVSVLLRQVQ